MKLLSKPPRGLRGKGRWASGPARDAVNARTPLDSELFYVHEEPGGFQLIASPVLQLATQAIVLPFSVLTQATPNSPGSWQRGVISSSWLFDGFPSDTDLEIIGNPGLTIDKLLNSDTPDQADPNWATMKAGATRGAPDVLWLEIRGDPVGGFVSAAIKSLGNGDTFNGGVFEYTGSPPVQTYARRIIAFGWFTASGPDSGPVWVPLVRNHLTLDTGEVFGKDNTGANPLAIAALVPLQS